MSLLASLFTWVWVFCGVLAATLYALGVYYKDQQAAMLYHPEMPEGSIGTCDSPVELRIPFSEEVSIKTSDGVNLRGFMLWPSAAAQGGASSRQPSSESAREQLTPSSNPGSTSSLQTPVLIYFHGNAGNVGHRIPVAQLLASQVSCAVLMMDYRGFGCSDAATINQVGLERDGQACIDHVWSDRRIARDRIVLMGTSLGGAVVAQLASKPHNFHRVHAIILENTFTSISDEVADLFRIHAPHIVGVRCFAPLYFLFMYVIKPLVLQLRWRSIDVIGQIRAPILFLSGGKDELVPPTHMQQLHKRALRRERVATEFKLFPDGTHNDLATFPWYGKVIHSFLDATQMEMAAEPGEVV